MGKKKFLVNGPISPEMIAGYLGDHGKRRDAGAHSLFLGQVRDDQHDQGRVSSIDYSAYDEMVEQEALKIIKETLQAFHDIKEIVIIHSTGRVNAGEISLFIMVTAGHRDQAIRGCRHILEMIKEDLPVWKKEIFSDSSHKWKE